MRIYGIYHQKGKDSLFKIWHASGEHILAYFHSDGGNIVSSDAVYEIRKGMLCFISADCYHYTVTNHPEDYERSKLIFMEDFFRKAADFLGSDELLRRFSTDSILCAQLPETLWEEADRLFAEVCEHYALLPLSALLKLLSWTDRYACESRPTAKSFAAGAMSYINCHIRENITVDDICSHVHMSKYYFCRKFKTLTGMTVMDYVLQTRITLAQSMLQNTDSSIGQISESCGFSSESYFCRVFKKLLGATPLQYRRQYR